MNSLYKAFAFLALLAAINVKAEISKQKIGVVIPLTGNFARFGEKVRKGIEKAPAESIEYIYEDEGCLPAQAIKSYKKLTNVDGIKYFLGPACGSPQTALAPMLNNNKQVVVLPNSAPRRVFELSKGRMFSAQHSIEEESIFNAQKAYQLGSRKVVILFFENDFSRAHEAAFTKEFKGKVLATLTYTSQDVSALKALLLRIKTLKPDTLYIPDAFPLMQGLMKELKLTGLEKLRVMSVYSAGFVDVLEVVGVHGDGLIFSYPDIGTKDAAYHFPEIAASMLAKATQECADSNDECVLKSLKSNNKFDEYGVLRGNLALKTIKNGKFVWFNKS